MERLRYPRSLTPSRSDPAAPEGFLIGMELSLMGDQAEEERRWDTLASVNDYKCESCGQKIPYGERNLF